jgi:hypothetical protein
MFTKQMADRLKIRSVSDGSTWGWGMHLTCTKQVVERLKIRSVSDGKRVGVGPHAD